MERLLTWRLRALKSFDDSSLRFTLPFNATCPEYPAFDDAGAAGVLPSYDERCDLFGDVMRRG